ncbi:MAG: hypothetical protein PV358_10165, partial [Acidimicrobiales bacterium]|nr:hypothetical protein [Acidimicrobiales bacterium]
MVAGEAVPVDVWLVPGRGDEAEDEASFGVLGADERARAGRFLRPEDRATYVAAHAALRRLAGARGGRDPAARRLG